MKSIVITLTAGLLALAAFSYRLTQQLHEERARLIALSTQLATVSGTKPDKAAGDQAIETSIGSSPVQFSEAGKAASARAATRPVPEIASAPFPSAAASLLAMQTRLRDPEERAKLKEQQIAMAKAVSPDAAEAMGMDAATYDRFEQFQAEQYLQNIERAHPNDLSPFEGDRDANDRIAAEFGGDVAARFETYKNNEVGNSKVKDVLGPLAEADVPLSKTQRQQLSLAFISAAQAEPSAAMITGPGDMREMTDYQEQYLANAERQNQRVLADAQHFLSESQLSVFKKSLEQQIALQRRGSDAMR